METQDASTEVAAAVLRMKSPDRSQVDPNPKMIDELIPPGHKARLVWELVRELDLTPLYAQIKAVEGHAGRPPIDPRILVALWLYATDEGIAKAREFPNPFNPTTLIEFELLLDSDVEVKVYNLTGNEIALLHKGFLSSGVHQFKFDASNFPSGIYLYQIKTPLSSQTRKMILAK